VNDALREAQLVDPEWAKKEGRRRAILGLLTVGVLVALAVGVPALVIGFHNGTEITKVEHSACQVEPGGKECQRTKVESSKAANLHTTCIPFFKAGYPCPKPGSTTAERVARRRSLRSHPVQGTTAPPTSKRGDATSAPTGHSEPEPSSGGSTGNGEHVVAPAAPEQTRHNSPEAGGGGPEPSAPESSGAAVSAAPTSSQSSSSSTTERVESTTVETPGPESSAPVRSAVGGVVEEAGSTVTGTVEDVTGTTCSLAKLPCP
jgi:hypothetical protein